MARISYTYVRSDEPVILLPMSESTVGRTTSTFTDRAEALGHFFQRAGEAPRFIAYDEELGCPLNNALATLEWTVGVGILNDSDLMHAARLSGETGGLVAMNCGKLASRSAKPAPWASFVDRTRSSSADVSIGWGPATFGVAPGTWWTKPVRCWWRSVDEVSCAAARFCESCGRWTLTCSSLPTTR